MAIFHHGYAMYLTNEKQLEMEWLKPLISSHSEGFEREEELTGLLLNHTVRKTAGSLKGNLQTDKGCWGRTDGHISKAEWFCLTARSDERN